MHGRRFRVLLIEDDGEDALLIQEMLAKVGSVRYQVEWIATFQEAAAAMSTGTHDVCLLDFRLGQESGLDLLREASAGGVEMPIILLTGCGGYEVDLEAMAFGAADYLDKRQVSPDILERTIRCAIERRRVEKALRESEARYRILFESASDAIFVHGLDGRILDVNHKACECLGFSEKELLSLSPGVLRPVSRIGDPADPTQPVGEGDHLLTETTCARKDGSTIQVELSSRLITVNAIPAVMSIARDITERKRAEKVVRENLHLLQTLIDAIPNPIFLVSIGGSYEGCNKAFEEYLGLTKEQILKRTIYDIYPGPAAGEIHEADRDLFDTPRMVIHEAVIPYADGSRRHIILSKAPYRSTEGAVTGLVGIMMDVTPLKETERKLREARVKAECANRAKSDFLSNMSHELRTPLNAIIGFTGLLIDNQLGDLNPIHLEYLKDVHSSAQHLFTLITGLLDFSNVESGSMTLHLSEIHVEDLLCAAVCSMEEEASKRHIGIETRLEEAPRFIVADERKLRRILQDLLSNALKFSPDGGSIQIVIRSTELPGIHPRDVTCQGSLDVSEPDPRECLEISVTDKGIGIRNEDIQRIFDPFEQADKSLSRKYQGAGLGLALSRRLVELHGGRIWAESEGEGKGSTFHVALPLRGE